MAQNWASYDIAAGSHDRLAGPQLFAAPARDLAAALALEWADRILDVGTGSGLAALMAKERARPGVLVCGLDPSIEMLRTARNRGLACVVAGSLPGLPFRDRRFDRVMASFVLSHVKSYEASLQDMARVLRTDGRLGVTAWGGRRVEARDFWDTIAERFVDPDRLHRAKLDALPWEDWLMDPPNLEQALRGCGLREVEVKRVEYAPKLSIADFLAIRASSIQLRFMRHTLPAADLERFHQTVAEEFHKRFSDPLDHTRDVLIGIGTQA